MANPAMGALADIGRNLFFVGIVATAVSYFTVTWWTYVAIATGIALVTWLVAKSQLD
jgi:hypothetical protein